MLPLDADGGGEGGATITRYEPKLARLDSDAMCENHITLQH